MPHLLSKIKTKFHNDKSNVNLMMYTQNNQQKFGIDSNNIPRNHMMDTISNEEGAKFLGLKNNPQLHYPDQVINRNIMFHTISNEQAELLSKGYEINHDQSKPRNKLLDIIPNEVFENPKKTNNPLISVNSDRVL